MLPDCTDDELLGELAVVVSTGWELPTRPNREHHVRHLLLLVNPADSLSYRQAAQRLLTMLDDALRRANDDVLGEDDRTGCRILLGVHPTYRSEQSPSVRRREAAYYLVPAWHEDPPRNPAGAFQRRHQTGVLRQVLECLRLTYGQSTERLIRDYDVIRTRRSHFVSANRQVTKFGETAQYRVRRDDLEDFVFSESDNPEGLLAADFRVLADSDEPAPVLTRIDAIDTQPRMREITLRLQRSYQAGEHLRLAWEEDLEFGPDAPRWGRDWAATSAPNDNFEAEVTVSFADDAQLPDVCWWYTAQPDTKVTEIGPNALANIFDLGQSRTATHAWSSAETERRIDYGLIWVWLDDRESRERWNAARKELEIRGP